MSDPGLAGTSKTPRPTPVPARTKGQKPTPAETDPASEPKDWLTFNKRSRKAARPGPSGRT